MHDKMIFEDASHHVMLKDGVGNRPHRVMKLPKADTRSSDRTPRQAAIKDRKGFRGIHRAVMRYLMR